MLWLTDHFVLRTKHMLSNHREAAETQPQSLSCSFYFLHFGFEKYAPNTTNTSVHTNKSGRNDGNGLKHRVKHTDLILLCFLEVCETQKQKKDNYVLVVHLCQEWKPAWSLRSELWLCFCAFLGVCTFSLSCVLSSEASVETCRHKPVNKRSVCFQMICLPFYSLFISNLYLLCISSFKLCQNCFCC